MRTKQLYLAPESTDGDHSTITRRVMKKSSDKQPRNKIFGRANRDFLIPHIEKMKNQGLTFAQIADVLSKDGWRTKSGKPVYESGLSRLLTENNIRSNEAHTRGGSSKAATKKSKVAADAPDWVRLVEAMLHSNLPDDAKLATIETTVQAAKRTLKR